MHGKPRAEADEVAARHAALGRGHHVLCTVIVAVGTMDVRLLAMKSLPDGPVPRSKQNQPAWSSARVAWSAVPVCGQ
jgi:hypothetical protein